MLQNENGNASMILQNILFHLALTVVWMTWAIKEEHIEKTFVDNGNITTCLELEP